MCHLPPKPSDHGCYDGWLYEAFDGGFIVKDRCTICNPAPWHWRRPQRSWFERYWLLATILAILALELLAPLIGYWIHS